jgi:hypothetical protein
VAVVLARVRSGTGRFLAILVEGRFGFVKDSAGIGFTGSRRRFCGSFGFVWHGKFSFVLGGVNS